MWLVGIGIQPLTQLIVPFYKIDIAVYHLVDSQSALITKGSPEPPFCNLKYN